MADEKEGGVSAADETAGSGEEGVLDQAVQKVREQKEEKVDFKVLKEEDLPKARRRVTIEIDRAEYEKRSRELFRDLQANATIEGFRRGKAPLSLLERRYGESAAREIVEKMATLAVHDYEKQNSLVIYGVPTISEYKVDDGKPVTIDIEMEIKPSLKPNNYTGRAIEVPRIEFKDSMVNDELEHLREHSATLEEVDEAFDPKKDHAIVLDLQAVNQKGHTVQKELDSENVYFSLPEPISQKLDGRKKGDSVEGRDSEVTYSIQVKAVKGRHLPELNDEFAKDLEADDLEALKKTLREKIQKQIDDDNLDQAFDVLTGELIREEQFDVPEALKLHVEREMMQNDLLFYRRTGMLPPRMHPDIGRQEYRAGIEEEALNRVKGFLLIDAIGLKENIVADEASIDAALAIQAEEHKRRPIAVRASMERNGQWDRFVEQVRFEKIRKFLLDNTKINYVEPKEEAAENAGSKDVKAETAETKDADEPKKPAEETKKPAMSTKKSAAEGGEPAKD